MNNNKGLTLVEVLLALFIFIIVALVFNKYYYALNGLMSIDMVNKEIGKVAKNKMEELKSGYIYINNDKYYILEFDEIINFKEENYSVDISIQPLDEYENINYINVIVTNEKEDISYNLIRYINFHENTLPSIYEELPINIDD